MESLGNLYHRSCFPPGSHALLARFPYSDQLLPVVVAPASATLVLWRGDQQGTTDHLRPFPALAETAWGRTAGTGGRHRTEGRRQQACARRVCSPFEGQQEVRLPLLPLLRAELGQTGQGSSRSPHRHTQEGMPLGGTQTRRWSVLLMKMKKKATDRFVRDARGGCYCAQRFLLLHHTTPHRRPLGSGKSVCRLLWPWPPLLDHHRRRADVMGFIVSEQVLHLEIQCASRSKQEGKNW